MRVHFAFGCVAPALLGPVAVAGPCVCGSVCLVRFVLLGLCSVCVFDCRLLRWDMTQSFSPMGGWVVTALLLCAFVRLFSVQLFVEEYRIKIKLHQRVFFACCLEKTSASPSVPDRLGSSIASMGLSLRQK